MSAEFVDEPIEMYLIGIAQHHNFFITSADICVHNFFPVAFVGISFLFGVGSIELAGIGCGLAGLGTYFGYQWHKKSKQNTISIKPSLSFSMMPEDPEDEKKRKRDQAREDQKPLTNKEARKLAEELGFKEEKNPPFNTHGELTFKKGNMYISPDNTCHKAVIPANTFFALSIYYL